MLENNPLFSHSLINLLKVTYMEDEILTIKEVAAYLKLTEKTAYRLVAEKVIPGFKVGGSWRFRKIEIEKWIDKQSKQEEAL